jgi:hypothetical protein
MSITANMKLRGLLRRERQVNGDYLAWLKQRQKGDLTRSNHESVLGWMENKRKRATCGGWEAINVKRLTRRFHRLEICFSRMFLGSRKSYIKMYKQCKRCLVKLFVIGALFY